MTGRDWQRPGLQSYGLVGSGPASMVKARFTSAVLGVLGYAWALVCWGLAC